MKTTYTTAALCAMALTLAACVSRTPVPELTPEAKAVTILDEPPTDMRLIDRIETTDGEGCGASGTVGELMWAKVKAVNKAAEMGGTAIYIEKEIPAHGTGEMGCWKQEHKVIALVYTNGDDLSEAIKWPRPGPNGEVICEGERSSARVVWATPENCKAHADLHQTDPAAASDMLEKRKAEANP